MLFRQRNRYGELTHRPPRKRRIYTGCAMSFTPDLTQLLNYQNPQVIKRYQRDFPNANVDAGFLFMNLLKYLWLCKKHIHDKKLHPSDPALDFIAVMHQEMRAMDDIWHVFILHTKDYADFCQKYFGEFLHHVPNVVTDQPEIFGDFEQECEKYLSYVYDNLGEQTVRDWFAEHLIEDDS